MPAPGRVGRGRAGPVVAAAVFAGGGAGGGNGGAGAVVGVTGCWAAVSQEWAVVND